jgi:Uma2 family endonuclease
MMYRLGDDDARIPDISFRLKEHIPDPLPNEYFGAPDLAVEIVSSESALELFRRVEDHLSGGSRTVWVVYPDTRAVIIYQPGGYSHVMHETDTLTADLLPGFAVNVGSLFPKS